MLPVSAEWVKFIQIGARDPDPSGGTIIGYVKLRPTPLATKLSPYFK